MPPNVPVRKFGLSLQVDGIGAFLKEGTGLTEELLLDPIETRVELPSPLIGGLSDNYRGRIQGEDG